MAMTHDYLDYLNQRVGIAPANSQEELQAAQTIAHLMSLHDVEPEIEEFDAPSLSGLFPAILSILMFLGVLFSGIGVLALTIVGFILALIPTVLAVLRLFGRAPSPSFGPAARSQNVVAVHRATGPMVMKGNRPIVVVAHYDTPRENFLYSTPIAPYLPLVVKVAKVCRYVVALCAFVQVLGFIPAPARLVFWLVGIVASLPCLLLAAGDIYERVSPCTLGANDNKTGVASLLGVMENVRPSGLVPISREPKQAEDIEEPEDDEAVEELDEPADFEGQDETAPSEPVIDEALVEEILTGRRPVDELDVVEEPDEAAEAVEDADLPEPEEPTPADEDVEVEEIDEFAELDEVVEPEEPVAADDADDADLTDELEADTDLVEAEDIEEPADLDEPADLEEAVADAGAEKDLEPELSAALDLEPEPAAEQAPVEDLDEPELDEPEPVEPPAPVRPRVVPIVRHGADVLRSLEILPESCEVDYVAADGRVTSSSSPVAGKSLFDIDDAPAAVDLGELDEPAFDEPDELEESSIEGTAPLRPISDEDVEATREILLSGGRFSLMMDEDDGHGVGPKDSSGLTELTDDVDVPAPDQPARRPAAPDDPEWGTSTYRPQLSNVARRASLFDLPDPFENEVDPLGDPDATRVTPSRGLFARLGRTGQNPVVPEFAPEDDEAAPVQDEVAPEVSDEEVSAPKPIETLSSAVERHKGTFTGLFDRLKSLFPGKGAADDDVDDEEPESWLGEPDAEGDEDDSEDDKVWRGGAAPRNGLRFVEEDEVAPSDEELMEEVLRLGDDALISHDIWFVALGGSSLDHAGMRAFLQQHRKEIRGSFVINLSCVGAGELSLLTHEGIEETRRADRRLGRILSTVARDVHIELGQANYDWTSTDALPAMSSRLRAVTLMGIDEAGMPALARTANDVLENVSGEQATLVTEIVTEAIRRA